MASLLSRLVRRTTGMSIGETIGSSIGKAVGGPTGAVIGSSIGGSITEAIDPNRQQQGQGVAISQATQTNPQETQSSGTITNVAISPYFQPASFGNIPIPPSTQQSGFTAANLPSMLFSGSAILGGAAAVIDLFFQDPVTGEVKRKKITRKFKAQVKQSVMLIGLEETANMLNTTPDIVVQILLKRFRNDGPFITKAAVRKTKATVRKMETVNMLTKDIAKLAGSSTTRRRATTGTRASTSRKTTVIQ
jgi:hypothetical protein